MRRKPLIRKGTIFAALFAIFIMMFWTSDWLAAVGFGLASLILIIAITMPTNRYARWIRVLRFLLILIAISIAWFSIVDHSRWYEYCENCDDHRFVDETRICGIPVISKNHPYHINTVSQIRTDLGMPCTHSFQRMHLVRVWGLAICARPCSSVTCCLSSGERFYDNAVSQRIRQYAADRPDEARKLYHRIVNLDDFDAMHRFISEIITSDSTPKRRP